MEYTDEIYGVKVIYLDDEGNPVECIIIPPWQMKLIEKNLGIDIQKDGE
jgi:hypothetical protein